MENQTRIHTVYSSPKTGIEYLIVAKPQSRVDYHEFMNPDTKYIREYTQYDVVLNGNPVQFCFDEKDIPEAVSRFENPLTDEQYNTLHSRFD